jgi:hypothetical protein
VETNGTAATPHCKGLNGARGTVPGDHQERSASDCDWRQHLSYHPCCASAAASEGTYGRAGSAAKVRRVRLTGPSFRTPTHAGRPLARGRTGQHPTRQHRLAGRWARLRWMRHQRKPADRALPVNAPLEARLHWPPRLGLLPTPLRIGNGARRPSATLPWCGSPSPNSLPTISGPSVTTAALHIRPRDVSGATRRAGRFACVRRPPLPSRATTCRALSPP